jgi:putative membrane protein
MAMLLVALHVAANLLWIGSISAVGYLLHLAARRTDGKGIAEVSRALYLRVAVPAFLASFTFGAMRVAIEPTYYLHLHWFHAKFTVAVAIMAIHHVLGGMTRKAAAGSMQAGRNGAILALGLFVFALAVVVLVTYRTVLIP